MYPIIYPSVPRGMAANCYCLKNPRGPDDNTTGRRRSINRGPYKNVKSSPPTGSISSGGPSLSDLWFFFSFFFIFTIIIIFDAVFYPLFFLPKILSIGNDGRRRMAAVPPVLT